MKKKIIIIILVLVLSLFLVPLLFLLYCGYFDFQKYRSQDFNIEIVKSSIDYNGNGIDDYTDILNGAKKEVNNKPRYKSVYYDGGYPPSEEGVCTDVIWRAFREAGYSLKDMVDNDIRLNQDDYDIDIIDENIDFRRVVNLRVFFDKYATVLTNDINEIEEWQPGDIIIFGNNKHIGIVSDYRNKNGVSYIIHNGGQPLREEDYLKRAKVTKHYRFDTSMIDENVLFAWED